MKKNMDKKAIIFSLDEIATRERNNQYNFGSIDRFEKLHVFFQCLKNNDIDLYIDVMIPMLKMFDYFKDINQIDIDENVFDYRNKELKMYEILNNMIVQNNKKNLEKVFEHLIHVKDAIHMTEILRFDYWTTWKVTEYGHLFRYEPPESLKARKNLVQFSLNEKNRVIEVDLSLLAL